MDWIPWATVDDILPLSSLDVITFMCIIMKTTSLLANPF